MAHQLVYDFARGGRVRAVLLQDRAPKTCAAILASLPHEAEALHARWAGREVFLPLPLAAKPPMENQVNRVSAGDVTSRHARPPLCVTWTSPSSLPTQITPACRADGAIL